MKVLIADDHALVREGLKKLLLSSGHIKNVVEAENGLEATEKAIAENFDLVILDFEMPKCNGIFASKRILEHKPGLPILMVSMFQSREHVSDAVNAGIKGFLPKESRSEDFLAAVLSVGNGHSWFKGQIAEYIAEEIVERQYGKKVKDRNQLTKRESQLLILFAEGMSSVDVADSLHISRRTVEVHKASIYKKLGVKNNTELIRYAIRNNLIRI